MANEAHLEILKQGVEVWNQWREEAHHVTPDLSHAYLIGANLRNAYLYNVDLRSAFLGDVDLGNTDLSSANLGNANLSDANLSNANLHRAILRSTFLGDADLSHTDLSHADLSHADLSHTNLSHADLSHADLSNTQAVATNFSNATLTEACVEDWIINSSTTLEAVICDSVYLKRDTLGNFEERRPRTGIFQPGDFATLFRKTLGTVDLIFAEGVDWKALLLSFQDLRDQYNDDNIAIQAMEKKSGGAFVVRFAVPKTIDKETLENHAKYLYTKQLNALDAQYEKQVYLQGTPLEEIQRVIDAERSEKATLISVLATMANNQQGPKYTIRGSQLTGAAIGNPQRQQMNESNHNNAALKKKQLTTAISAIQRLLKQLEKTNPSATETEQIAFVSAAIPSNIKQQAANAFEANSPGIFEELLDDPYVDVAIASVKGWTKKG